jgi:three-Cys-motif partner protein
LSEVDVLENHGPHTEAKHRLLRGYLDAWIPILGQARGWRPPATDLVLVDGFAGPGRYTDGSDGSPLIMVKSYLDHAARSRLDQNVWFFFIEKETAFVEHLRSELSELDLRDPLVHVEVISGLYEIELPRLLNRLRETFRPEPPMFAFIDPFGLKDNSLDLTTGLTVWPRCDTLTYLPTGFMARLGQTPEFQPGMDKLFGGRDRWVRAFEIEGLDERRLWLRERFREIVRSASGGDTLPFDIKPEGSSNVYSLVFRSSHIKGVERMKDVMWKVDPSTGQFFHGGLRRRQPTSLFDAAEGMDEFETYGGSQEPDLSLLSGEVREHFGDQGFQIEEAERFVLLETVFKKTHLRSVLTEAEKAGGVIVVESRRKRPQPGWYPPGTVLRFPP